MYDSFDQSVMTLIVTVKLVRCPQLSPAVQDKLKYSIIMIKRLALQYGLCCNCLRIEYNFIDPTKEKLHC